MLVPAVIVSVIFSSFAPSSSLTSEKALEGYPTGYLSDCPKGTHEPIIRKKTLKRLFFCIHEHGNKYTFYNYYQMNLLGSKMDFNKTTVVYVGGYVDFPQSFFGPTFDSTYKKIGYNVLLLDNNYFTTMQYPVAALFARTVGKHVAEMLLSLTQQGLDPKKLELVGFSLGAQTVSFVAKHYRHLSGMNVSRVTGLEPAGPCFRNLGPEERLDQTDADLVDTINTNIDGFGMAAPVGHVNFYVNGGEFQPGDFIWMPCGVLCSHIRSFTIWMSSLRNQDSFIAMQCSSVQEARSKSCYDKTPQITNVVGPKTDKRKQGVFYLATGQNFPYFLGEKGLKRENEFFSRLMENIVNSNNLIL